MKGDNGHAIGTPTFEGRWYISYVFPNPRENTQHFKKKNLLEKPLLALAISIDVLFIYFFRSVPRVESIAADWEPLNKVG